MWNVSHAKCLELTEDQFKYYFDNWLLHGVAFPLGTKSLLRKSKVKHLFRPTAVINSPLNVNETEDYGSINSHLNESCSFQSSIERFSATTNDYCKNTLKIGHLNANGIYGKQTRLSTFSVTAVREQNWWFCLQLTTQSSTLLSHYYMAGSASGQDESNPALWLATRAGKMELSCPLGITRCPSAWHRKFNPNNNAGFLRFSRCFGGKRSLKSSVNSQHLPTGKEREWNRPSVVKTLFQLQWMWVESVSCSACSNLDRIDFEKLIVSSRVPNW